MEDGVLLHRLDELAKSLLTTFKKVLYRAPAIRNVFERNAKEILRKRKHPDTIGTVANAIPATGNISQVFWGAGSQGLEAAIGELRFQETRKFFQGSTPNVFQ